jgi:hypothetical protein
VKRLFVIACTCVVVALGTAAPAFAHGHRTQGDLEFVFGWAVEPAFLGQPNAVQLMIEQKGKPVEGAENTLKVTVSIGDEATDPLELRTVFDAPGEYRADMIPTVVGGYTFHFTGTIEGEDVDQTVTSPKDGFDEVHGTSDVAFPKQAPSTSELAEKLAAVQRDADDAKGAVGLARALAIGAMAVGIAGIAMAISRRRA